MATVFNARLVLALAAASLAAQGAWATTAALPATAAEARAAFELALQLLAARDGVPTPAPTDVVELRGVLEANRSLAAPFVVEQHQKEFVHILRVPKAGSTQLSVLSRALVGCGPDGLPCCLRIKKQEANCPQTNICSKVRGCLNHYPHFYADERLPILTQMRAPAQRLCSAFFYRNPHRPTGDCHTWECFEKFVKIPKFRNILTRMLNGAFAYSTNLHARALGPAAVASAKQRVCNLTWIGFTDLVLGGALLLYATHPFSWIRPNPVAFGLPAAEGTGLRSNETTAITPDALVRKNGHPEYGTFLKQTYPSHGGDRLVAEYHAEDIEVYAFARRLNCARMRESGVLAAAEGTTFERHLRPACSGAGPTAGAPEDVATASELCRLAR